MHQSPRRSPAASLSLIRQSGLTSWTSPLRDVNPPMDGDIEADERARPGCTSLACDLQWHLAHLPGVGSATAKHTCERVNSAKLTGAMLDAGHKTHRSNRGDTDKGKDRDKDKGKGKGNAPAATRSSTPGSSRPGIKQSVTAVPGRQRLSAPSARRSSKGSVVDGMQIGAEASSSTVPGEEFEDEAGASDTESVEGLLEGLSAEGIEVRTPTE